MNTRITRTLGMLLTAGTTVLAVGLASTGVAEAAQGGDGQRGSDGIGVAGVSGRDDSTTGLVGTSTDGVNPQKVLLGG